MKEIITKAHKSWTLIFNWFITVAAVLAEVAIQNMPALKEAIDPEYYIYALIAVTVVNKLLRAKTTSGLKDK